MNLISLSSPKSEKIASKNGVFRIEHHGFQLMIRAMDIASIECYAPNQSVKITLDDKREFAFIDFEPDEYSAFVTELWSVFEKAMGEFI